MKHLTVRAKRLFAIAAVSIFVLLGANACTNEATEEVLTGEGAGWSAILTLSNTCKFDEGLFNSPECRFRTVVF